MIRINLLPHREEKRKQKKAAFVALLALGGLAGGCAMIPGLLDLVASRTKISSAVVSPFKGMQLGADVRESQLRTEAPAYLVACGLALRRFG